jgi:hypothetical protein
MFTRMRTSRLRVLLPMVLACVTIVVPGCGGDSTTGPGMGFTVFGVIFSDGSEAGTPIPAIVVVAKNGAAIHDAEVAINGAPFEFFQDPEVPSFAGYGGMVELSPGQEATLSVSCPYGDRTMRAVVPGGFAITSPVDGWSFSNGQDIPVVWTAASHAEEYLVSYYNDDVLPLFTHHVPEDSTTFAIPGEETQPDGDMISVYALNGTGDSFEFPYEDWFEKNGFWAFYEDVVSVQVSPFLAKIGANRRDGGRQVGQ